MELAFAGLHALCAPMLGRLGQLPVPQRDALNTAFGMSAGPPPDRFLVGLAVLSLLADAAEEQPLVCIVDDAQWLDRVSVQTLAFVARRLLAERVGLVFALRESGDDHELEGLPELVIEGLAADDARRLLDATIPGSLDARVRDRILGEAGGNPLALLELPRERSTARGRVRAASGDAADQPHRAGLRATAGAVPSRYPATAAAGGGRAGRRRDAAVACGRAARHRARRGGTGRGGGPGRDRRARAVPPSAPALGRLPGRDRTGATRGPSGARRRDRRAGWTRIAGPGTALARQDGRTRP